jgi:hypothetical protein
VRWVKDGFGVGASIVHALSRARYIDGLAGPDIDRATDGNGAKST